MSLKQNLIEYLQIHGRITLDQLYLFCGKEHKNTSNAERRLRELMEPKHKDYNPHIKTERNAKGAIIGYVWSYKAEIASPRAEFNTTATTPYCCYSNYKFQIHDPNCQTLKVKENRLW